MNAFLLIGMLAAWDPRSRPMPPLPDGPPPGMDELRDDLPARRPTWFDSAMTGLARKPWSGVVELELPEGRRDTAKVCGGPTGFRIDFSNGRSLWESGDSSVFLDSTERSARHAGRRFGHHGPPPGIALPVCYGSDTYLGRKAMVYSMRGPRGGAHRMWIDTTIPLLLRGEGPGPGARRILKLDLSHGCPADAFTVPSGWAHEKGGPLPPTPHEETDISAVEKALGFRIPRPTWLPAGFEPAGQSWMEGHHHRISHLRWSDGSRLVSLFAHEGDHGFQDCEQDRPCRLAGPDPVVVRHFNDVSVLVTGPLSPADLKHIADGLH